MAVREGLSDLLITAGLAATLTAAASFVNEFAREGQERHIEGCRLAASILQDETPSPTLNPGQRSVVLSEALAKFRRCIRE